MERDDDTRIHKYSLPIGDEITIKLPARAEILHVGLDGYGIPCIWAKVNRVAPDEERMFYVVGTGHPFPCNAGEYIGTFQQGMFIWHVFAKGTTVALSSVLG